MIKKNMRDKNTGFMESLTQNRSFKELQFLFDRLLARPMWWFLEKKAQSNIKPFLSAKRPKEAQDYLRLADYKSDILRAIARAARSMNAVSFELPKDAAFGVAIPVVRGSKLAGFFGLSGLKSPLSDSLLGLLLAYSRSITGLIDKEAELARLYELVRPRAIALSTVHTIHRLISSTLDIKELFPKIARLSLQILKAERVRICILNQDSKELECVASIDYRKSNDLFKLNAHPTPIESRVFKTGRSVYKKNILCVPLVDEEICGVIAVRDKADKKKFSIFDHEIITTLAEQAAIAIRNAQLYKEQEDLTAGTIKSLGYLLDAKFPGLYTHTGLFKDLMLELGKQIGLAKRELKMLYYSALLPDLGKLVVPTEILQKKKALNKVERKMIKTHTVRGIEVLKYIGVLKPVVPIILHHHEKYNGTGYPDRLRGRHIPLGSRIMAVVDAFEAMICHRPYREPMPFRMAVSEIRRQSGRQFDPDIVDSFVAIAKDGRLELIVSRYAQELKQAL
ncbi:MAG: HD domain-containing protein [Candidatus Omnitrophica bacterium]|nr:HD domain-containing protein [Candidatus Omnitrophota bacterium]